MRKIQLACVLLLTAALALTLTACTFGGDGSGATTTTDLAALHALHFSADPAVGGTVSARTADVVLVDGQEIAEGTAVFLTAAPKTGYDFDGWYEGATKVGTERIFTFNITADRTVVAKFTAKRQYTLTYAADNSAGGSVSGDVESGTAVLSGTAVTLTATPAAGYDFDGWYEAGVKIGSEARCTLTLTADRNLVAKFTAQSTAVTTHTVNFVIPYDSSSPYYARQQVEDGQCATPPTQPQWGSRRFIGWFNGENAFDFSTPITGDLTLLAKFESTTPVTTSYTVGFIVNEQIYTSQQVIAGQCATPPIEPQVSGQRFVGWYLDENAFDFSTPITGGLTLTAKFESIPPVTTTHTVNFASPFFSTPAYYGSQQVEDGQCATPPAEPQVGGLYFVGWYLGEDAFDFSTPITSDLTLVARFGSTTPVTTTHTVTFVSNGTTYDTQQVTDGQCATPPTEPQVSGQRFVGWFNGNAGFDFSTPVTSDLRLTAKFEAIPAATHTVTFIANGQTHATQQVTDGQCATEPTAPQVSGQRFVGWFNGNASFDFSTPVTSDLTLTAKFEPVTVVTTHTVTFVSNGTTYDTQQVTDGQCATPPTEPQISGQRFVGWFNGNAGFDFSTPVTSDLTLTARFESTVTPNPDPVNNFTLTRQDNTYTLSLSGSVNVGGFIGVITVSGDVIDQTFIGTDCGIGDVNRIGNEIHFVWSHGCNVQEGFDVLSLKTDGQAALVIEEIYLFGSDGSIVPAEYHINGI